MNTIARYAQVVFDLSIPLIGFFCWKWNLCFIVFFYILDLSFSSVFSVVKMLKIRKLKCTPIPLVSFLMYIFLFFLVLIFSYLTLLNCIHGISIKAEIIRFLCYEDMGMQQWMFLFPLMFLGSYMNYKVTFLLPKEYEIASIDFVVKKEITTLKVLLGFIGLLLASSFINLFSEGVYLLFIVISTAIYRFFQR